MTNDNAAVEQGAQQQPQPQGESMLQFMSRMAVMFVAMQFLTNLAQQSGILPKALHQQDPAAGFKSPPPPSRKGEGAATPRGASPTGAGAAFGRPTCLWPQGTVMDLHVFVTDGEDFDVPASNDKKASGGDVLAEWHEAGLVLGQRQKSAKGGGDDDDSLLLPERRTANVTVPVTRAVRNNETHLFAHVRLVRRRSTGRDTGDDGEQAEKKGGGKKNDKVDVLSKTVKLTRHRVRKRVRDEKSLLGGDGGSGRRDGGDDDDGITAAADAADGGGASPAADDDDTSPLSAAGRNTTHDQVLLYVKPSITLQLVDLGGAMQFPNRANIPVQFGTHMDWLDESSSLYYPILFPSEFWITKDSLRLVNGTSDDEISVEMTFEPIKMWKWQLMAQMETTWRQQEEMTGDEDAAGSDVFRTMLLDTNPILLAITAIVSVLHTVFDILAFKNDISFFKGRKSMEGLSLRSMIVNAAFQVVILLYLADNETSFMVLMSNGVGLAIEVWKISKAVTVSFSGGKIQWEEAKSYSNSKTKEYDEIATSHLLFVTMPLVSGYGFYSLVHQKHRGWYSWILNTLVGFIYMFGFVMMTPQLFINYKLQSVAHLNWRTMTYKSINTFIDDLFAFVIKMPIMHRLACLRDDVVFFVFCYQRYIYRTDYTRVNEYGQCAAPTEEMIREREEEEARQKRAATEGGNELVENSSVRGGAEGTSTTVRRRGARDKRT